MIESEVNHLQAEPADQFAATIAHDLLSHVRNIAGLATIQATAISHEQMALAGELNEKISRQADQIGKIIADLRLINQMRADKLCDESVNIGELLELIIEQHIGEAGERDRFEIGSMPTIWINRTAIWQIFDNLVRNAINHGKPGQPVAINHNRTNGINYFQVRNEIDTHQNLNANQADKVMNTGLGLMISRRVIAHLGGEIRVNQKNGVFMVEIAIGQKIDE